MVLPWSPPFIVPPVTAMSEHMARQKKNTGLVNIAWQRDAGREWLSGQSICWVRSITCSNPVERYIFTSPDLLLYPTDGRISGELTSSELIM